MRLVIASNNAGKIREIREIIGDWFDEVCSLGDLGISLEVEEDGDTFAYNAQKKAREVCAVTGLCALGDDSGLCVDFLGGAPGVYSARFAGERANDDENNRKLLEQMADVPAEKRGARFVCCMALCYPDGRMLTVEGECRGSIAHVPAGDRGFGYDPVFYVEELGKTFGEIDDQTKNRISHRAVALGMLKQELERRSGGA
ncbi:MAG: XTP/dITP diphosphatase [Christensenellales bacterium]|jgi:XTP/dITP diphosphohydrolase